MPVIRRKAVPVAPAPVVDISTASPLFNEKETRAYLRCSKHEVRELVNRKILRPVPYLRGRVKPWRFLRSQIDEHIADQATAA